MHSESHVLRGLPLHAAVTALTVVVSLGSLGLLLAAFDQASPSQWAQSTPELVAELSQCDALHERRLREGCAREVAQAAVQRRTAVLMVAGR